MKLKAFTYSLPFKEPFTISQRIFRTREGIIIELKKGKYTALGEAAPLPGFSKETLQEASDQLKEYVLDIKNIFGTDLNLQSLQLFYRKNEILPSLQFALDTLAVDYLSQQAGLSAYNFLFDSPETTLKVNGVVAIQNISNTLKSVEAYVKEGYQTIKIKTGADFEKELDTIEKVRAKFPDLTIRLDANKAWGLKEACDNLDQLEPLKIEYCEEPLKTPSIENLKKVSASVAIPIALDESLLMSKSIEYVAPHVSVIIIKPMVLGSLSKLFATNRLANHHNNKVIYTTSLESGIGRTMTATLAAGLGTSNSAHGLATGSLLKMDVWHDGTYINNGCVSLPDRIELGKRYHANHKHIITDRIDL